MTRPPAPALSEREAAIVAVFEGAPVPEEVAVLRKPICGVPCPKGGQEALRRRSRAELGWMGHCNRRVKREGDRCFMHLAAGETLRRCPGSGQRTLRGGFDDPDRCPVCKKVAYVCLDGTTGSHQGPPPPRPVLQRVDLPGEEWRPVPGWEGTHEVSNMGRVYSLPRPRTANTGRILRQMLRPTGHYSVGLVRPDKTTATLTVHQLMMRAFVGPQEPGVVVRHLDGDPANNVLSNLRYGTVSDNERDRVLHGTHFWASKTHCPQGHPYDEENTLVSRGSRHCRTCRRARDRARTRNRSAA